MNQIEQINRVDIDQLQGSVVVEFGAGWCGYCQAAQPVIAAAFVNYPHVQHIKIEDGKGRRLGRTFAVKLWPTLVFLKDGVEFRRMVRPADVETIVEALNAISVD